MKWTKDEEVLLSRNQSKKY